MLDILSSPIEKIWMPIAIMLGVFFVLWCIYGLFSLLYHKNEKGSVKCFYTLVAILSVLILAFLCFISYKFHNTLFERIFNKKSIINEEYSIILTAGLLASITFGLLIYSSIIFIRKHNENRLDRKSLRVIPYFISYVGMILSLVVAGLILYPLVSNFIKQINTIETALFNLVFYTSSKNIHHVNAITKLTLFSLVSFVIVSYSLLALKENKKINAVKYISDTIFGVLFASLFSIFTITAMKDVAGPFANIRIMPVFFIVALFSYKYGFKRSLPFALLIAQVVSSISIALNYTASLQTPTQPIRYTFVGLILIYYLPTVAMASFGTFLTKKQIFLSSIHSNILVYVLRAIPIVAISLVYPLQTGSINNTYLTSIIVGLLYLGYEHVITLLMFTSFIMVKKGKKLFNTERLNNRTIDQNWIDFEAQFIKKKIKKANKK